MNQYKMSVAEMCSSLGWTPTELSRQAGINVRTANRAYEGEEPSPRTKRDICKAFSAGFGRQVLPGEISWAKED